MGKKIRFEDALREFSFEQFYELCRIFEVDVVDRQSVRDALKEATSNNEKVDFSEVKMRRDFANLEKELIEKYYGHNRAFRRQVNRIIDKVVTANRKATKILTRKLEDQYQAGLENLNSVMEMSENTDNSTSNAAEASEVV